MHHWQKVLLLVMIPTAFFLTGLLTLSDYGVNTDEPFHFMRGQAYLHYYLTGSKNYDNLEGFNEYIKANAAKTASDESVAANATDETTTTTQRFSAYQQPTHTAADLIATDVGHPPLNGILAAGFNKVFYQQLGWLGDIESYHLFEITIATLGIMLIMWWAYLEFGLIAALFTGLALALHPMYLGESRFNIKDPIETVFFAATLFAVWRTITLSREKQKEDNVFKWLLLGGIAFGAALATKFNALFVLPIVGLWFVGMLIAALIQRYTSTESFTERHGNGTSRNSVKISVGVSPLKVVKQWFNVGTAWGYPLALLISGAVVYAAWPNLWGQASEHLSKVYEFYFQLGTSEQYATQFITKGGWNLYPLLDVILRAPLITLILFGIGTAGFVRYWKTPQFATLLLWAIWLAIPIVRVILPGKALYGATRQIMEYLPALALFAGVGAAMVVDSFGAWWAKRKETQGYTPTESYTEEHGKRSSSRVSVKNSVGVSPLIRSWFNAPTFVSAALVLCYVPILITLTRLHPNPQLFYNSLIGGLKGAHDVNFPFWDNTMNNAYVEGIKWLNDNAEPQAHLSMVTALRSSLPPHKLRDDIDLSNMYFSGPLQEGEYIMEILPIPESSFIPKYINKFLAPVYTYAVDGVPLLAVWHNDGKHIIADVIDKNIGGPESKVKGQMSNVEGVDAKITSDGASLSLDFGKIQTFQRLEFLTPVVGSPSAPLRPATEGQAGSGQLAGCVPLTEGALSVSSDGKTYKRLENIPFVAVNRPEFQTHDVPDYLLAGDRFRYVSISPNKDACLLKATQVIGWISN